MDKIKLFMLAVLIFILGLACNLTSYLSDTPPYQPEETSQGPQIAETDMPVSCFRQEFIPSNFSKSSNIEAINTENISKYFEDAFSKVFPDTRVTLSDTYLSDNQDQVINCVVISPLKTLEKTAFDLMIRQPDLVEQFVNFPNIEVSASSINNLIQNLGDSRTAYHIEVTGSPIQLDIIIYRKNDGIVLINFLTKGSNANHNNLIELASKLN